MSKKTGSHLHSSIFTERFNLVDLGGVTALMKFIMYRDIVSLIVAIILMIVSVRGTRALKNKE